MVFMNIATLRIFKPADAKSGKAEASKDDYTWMMDGTPIGDEPITNGRHICDEPEPDFPISDIERELIDKSLPLVKQKKTNRRKRPPEIENYLKYKMFLYAVFELVREDLIEALHRIGSPRAGGIYILSMPIVRDALVMRRMVDLAYQDPSFNSWRDKIKNFKIMLRDRFVEKAVDKIEIPESLRNSGDPIFIFSNLSSELEINNVKKLRDRYQKVQHIYVMEKIVRSFDLPLLLEKSNIRLFYDDQAPINCLNHKLYSFYNFATKVTDDYNDKTPSISQFSPINIQFNYLTYELVLANYIGLLCGGILTAEYIERLEQAFKFFESDYKKITGKLEFDQIKGSENMSAAPPLSNEEHTRESYSSFGKIDQTPFAELPGIHPETKRQLVRFLRRMKAKNEAPLGLVLYGPPGTGKTMIASKLAQESGRYFIQTGFSAWERGNIYHDVIKSMYDDFEKARKNAPSVIFIDEIDELSLRDPLSHNGGAYKQGVTNAFLNFTSGAQPRGDVTIIGATNLFDAIDPAVLRPGRLGTHIEINLPDIDGVEALLRFYLPFVANHGSSALDDLKRRLGAGRSAAFIKDLADAALAYARDEYDDAMELSKVAKVDPSSPLRRHVEMALMDMIKGETRTGTKMGF
jgi:hypothetical protein